MAGCLHELWSTLSQATAQRSIILHVEQVAPNDKARRSLYVGGKLLIRSCQAAW